MSLNLNGPKPPKDTRMVAAIVAIAAALALGVSAFTKHWLQNEKYIAFGPMGYTQCDPQGWGDDRTWECKSGGNSEWVEKAQKHNEALARLKRGGGDFDPDDTFAHTSLTLSARDPLQPWKASGAFTICGFLTLGASLLGAVGLIVGAVLALQKKRLDLPVAPTTLALLSIFVAMIVGCIFVATKPGPVGMVGVSWGFWLFGIGTVGGIVAGQMLAKLLRPVDPDLAHIPDYEQV